MPYAWNDYCEVCGKYTALYIWIDEWSKDEQYLCRDCHPELVGTYPDRDR